MNTLLQLAILSMIPVRLFAPTLGAVLCLLTYCQPLQAEEFTAPPNVTRRSNFQNSRIRFERNHIGHVAFIGGSITEMDGYRPMVMKDLQTRFPNTKFQFTSAGIASTCSTAGAFRLRNDVLSKGKVDLIFIEFAVNDDQDASHPYEIAVRGIEGIIRHTREHSPNAEIFLTYFVNPGMLEKLQHGQVPTSIAAHEKVADHYGVTTIHLAQQVADQIEEGSLTWKKYGGVHPAPFGNAIPAKMIAGTLDMAWMYKLVDNAKLIAAPVPKESVDQHSYTSGRYVSMNSLDLGEGWEIKTPDWSKIKGQIRSRHNNRDMITCTAPESTLSFSFKGTAVGVECVAGPDAGTLEYSIDGSEWKSFNLSHRFSKGLHYPRTVVFEGELENQKHKLKVRLSSKTSNFGLKPAARILNFVVNE